MLFRPWLRYLKTLAERNAASRRRQQVRRKARGRYRPLLESLEDRTVPSAVSWVGGSGDWDTASNWSTGSVPTAADDVTINVNNISVTHNQGSSDAVHSLSMPNSTDNLSLAAGSLTLSAASTVSGALTLSGATLTGTGNLAVSGLLTWSGGTMSGSGTTFANGGLTINGSNVSETLDTRTLVNPGAATWSGSGNNLYLLDGAIFNNQASGSFTVNNDQNIYNGGATPIFVNAGTFTKAAGTATTSVYAFFKNTGTVTVSTATLALQSGGGTSTSSASFSVASGATLDFAGGIYKLGSSSTVSGAGTVVFGGGTVDVVGTFNITGSTSVTGGTVNFNSTVTSLGTPLTISNGTANLGHNSVSIATLNLTGGTLTGSGTITVTSQLTWNNYGIMSGIGSTTLASTATMTLGGGTGYDTLDTRTFTNNGTVTWVAGSASFSMNNGAVFNNQAGATFTINNDQAINTSAATATFNNAGTFTKAAGTGTTAIYAFFNNTGTVNVKSGTLALQTGGKDTSSGSFVVPSGSTLNFASGFTSVASSIGTSTTPQAGSILFSNGTTDVTGSYNVSGSTSVTGGTANFTGTVTSLGSSLTITGTANISENVSIATLDLTGGILTGSGAITVTGQLTWRGYSTMSGTGSTTVAATTGSMTLGGDNSYQTLDGRTFNNLHTVTWAANSGPFYMDDGAVFNNKKGATFTTNNDQAIYSSGATPTFNNTGTFTKTASSGTTAIYALFNNTGTLNVNSGTVALETGGNSTNTFTVASGATLDFAGGLTGLSSKSKITGPGAVVFGGGTATIAGTYNVTGSTSVTGGTANFTGTVTSLGSSLTIGNSGTAYLAKNVSVATLQLTGGTLTGPSTVTVTSQLTWNDYGTMSGTGSTVLASTATMTLGGDSSYETLDARTFTNNHTVTWAANSPGFVMEDGAVFNNQAGATFTDDNDGSIQAGSGAMPSFNNAGTFTKTGDTNITSIYVLFNNSGTVNVSSGTLQPMGGGNDSGGSFAVAAGASLNFYGGNTALGSGVSGAGAVLFSGGNIDVAGTYNITGSTTVAGATVNFGSTLTSLGTPVTISSGTANFGANSFSVATLNLTGGTLTGSGNITVTTQMAWDGYSTMSGTGSTTLAGGATLTLGGDGSAQTLDARTFTNNGTVTWAANSANFYLYDGAVFNNQTGATFTDDNSNGHNISPSGIIGAFNNAGTYTQAAVSTATFYVLFNNTGTVNITGGTLVLQGGGTGGGTFAVSSGATLSFAGGTNNLNASPSTTVISGAGSVVFSGGETDIAGLYNLTGGTTVSGGTANFANNVTTGTFANSGGTVIINNPATGTTTFTVSGGDYTQSGGSTYLNGATLAVAAGHQVNIEQNTYFYALGTINGNLTNAGHLYVGGQGTAGILTVSGNYTQTSNGTLVVNIGGATAGSQYSQLNITGSAALAGTLTVNLIDAYSPPPGTSFTILTYASESGDFSTKNLSGLGTNGPGATSYVLNS